MLAASVWASKRAPSNDARRTNAEWRSTTCSTRSPSDDGTTQSPTATSAPMLRIRNGSIVAADANDGAPTPVEPRHPSRLAGRADPLPGRLELGIPPERRIGCHLAKRSAVTNARGFVRDVVRNVADMLARLARCLCRRHRWIVIGVWLPLLVGHQRRRRRRRTGLPHRLHASPTASRQGRQDLLEGEQPGPGRVHLARSCSPRPTQGVDDPDVRADARADPRVQVDEIEGVTVTSPYDNPRQISEDGTIGFAQLDIADRGFRRGHRARPRRSRSSATSLPPSRGLQIEYGGDIFAEFELPESEILGLLAAVIILILAFGSVLAMGLPIGTALFGLGIGVGARDRLRQQRRSRCPTSPPRWWR